MKTVTEVRKPFPAPLTAFLVFTCISMAAEQRPPIPEWAIAPSLDAGQVAKAYEGEDGLRNFFQDVESLPATRAILSPSSGEARTTQFEF